MSDPMQRAAERRLAALLRDEEYGPKLARLNRADERIILDLIDANRGREARKQLDKLDENRRVYRSMRTRARDYAGKPRSDRKSSWRNVKDKVKGDHEQEFWRLYRAAVLA
jgi:hypothetical protein